MPLTSESEVRLLTEIRNILIKFLDKARIVNATTTGQLIKAGYGKIGRINIVNTAASIIYVKFYDKATAGASTDTPMLTLPLASGIGIGVTHSFVVPVSYGLGLSVRCVTGIADNDTTNAATSPIIEIEYTNN